jgi:hypothetical protein
VHFFPSVNPASWQVASFPFKITIFEGSLCLQSDELFSELLLNTPSQEFSPMAKPTIIMIVIANMIIFIKTDFFITLFLYVFSPSAFVQTL